MKHIILTFFVIPLFCISQHTIKGSFSPAENFSFAFLYRATPDGAIYIDRAELDSLGQFSIPLRENAEAGIYKIVYAIPPEKNNFDIVYNGKEDVAFSYTEGKGVVFTTSKENKLWDSYLKSIDMVNQTISNYFTKNEEDKTGFTAIFKTLEDTQTSYENLAKGTLINTFIKANRPYIPEEYQDLSTYSEQLKLHFFKHIDFSNDLLRSSNFMTDHITGFIFGLSENTSDSTYKAHVDILAKALKPYQASTQSPVFELVWQQFKRQENHKLANYIIDAYLLDIAISSNNKVLEQQLLSYKNTSIGVVAPDFTIKNLPKPIKLSELNGKTYYILLFWSSGCGHCLKELPKVKAFMNTITDTEVVAFGLENDNNTWAKEILKYPDFIHGIGLGKWEHPIVQTYGIPATPTYFVLDANKVIIAKPYDVDALEAFFKTL